MPGQIFGDRYEVEQQLGKKAGRWTLLARDIETDERVILKLLFVDDETHQDDLKLFTREVQVLQAIEHPATPKYLGYFEIDLIHDGKALALIQSYVNGTSLEQYLKSKRTLSETEARWLAKAVLKILLYLHTLEPPVVHRDIKPSNVLLSKNADTNTPKASLVDFGSIKSIGIGESTSFTMVGTDGYMPPEQMGRRAVRASDLYGLGMTLVTAATGVEPHGMPRRGLRVDIDQMEGLQEFEPAFLTWLTQMIEPELSKRFQTADEALQALRAIDAGRSDG
ncbi:MAG TPA: serine/threonine-protein kinase [Chroococcidiopsis sp.]